MSDVLDENVKEVTQEEYATVSYVQAMYFGAIVFGAFLGMILSILALAIINGGTLDFNQADEVRILIERIIELEQQVQQLSAQ